MKYNQQKFLSQFDQPLRRHIINFCNTLSKTNYDVYLLLARKAACFIDTLIDLDLIELNGAIISDRVLEYDTDWLKGKSIAIVDDTIISGTTIFKIIKRIKSISNNKIDVHAFCINEYWFVNEMLENEKGINYLKEPYLKLDHSSSLKFCKNIVDALALTPRPYNIDFPIYENIKFTSNKLNALFRSSYWRIVETTSTKQEENDILCLTINPSKKFIAKFEETLGWGISKIAHFKLRLYSTKNTDISGKITYFSKIVPYIIFNPITVENSNEVINRIFEFENLNIDYIFSKLKTQTSLLCFIQYYYSEILFRTWVSSLEKEIDINSKYVRHVRSMYFLFSPEIVNILLSIKYENQKSFTEYSKLFLTETFTPSLGHNIEFNPVINLNELLKPFLDLYYFKELPARRIVKQLNKKAFEDFSYIDTVNRLDDGISINELKIIVSKNVTNVSDINQIVSLFLDKYIDNGIIVPITIHKKNLLYRGYRHGEEIIWGNYNNRLLGKYFEQYLRYIDSTTINEIFFQKLLVLFLKLGLKEGVLEEYSTLTPRNIKTKLISVKAHLFGMVSDYTELEPNEIKIHLPIIDQNIKSYWTSKFLEDCNMINIKNNAVTFDFDNFDKPYTIDIGIDEPTDIDQSDLDTISQFADTFGYLRKNKLLSESELVLMTSCVNLHDNTASLGAELQIYLNGIGSYRYKLANCYSAPFTINKLKQLRDKNINYVWTAVNSGYFKFNSYTQNKGIEYVKKVEKHFEDNNSYSEARIWRRYWRNETELNKNEVNDLVFINYRMGQMLLEANLLFTVIHLIIFELLKRQGAVELYSKSLEEEIGVLKNKINPINEEIVKLKSIDKVSIDNNSEVLKLFIEEKNKLNKRIGNIRDEIKYWEKYPTTNLSFVEDLKSVFFRENISIINSRCLLKISNSYYIQLKSDDLERLLTENLYFIDELSGEVKRLVEDYKLTVPEWGKIQQKVKCNNFIHINSNEQDLKARDHISKIIRHLLSEFELEEFENESATKSISLLKIQNAGKGLGGLGRIIGFRGQFIQERLLKFAIKLLAVFKEKNIDIFISVYPDLMGSAIDLLYNNDTKNFDIVNYNLFEELEQNQSRDIAIIYDKFNKHSLTEFIGYKSKYFGSQYSIYKGGPHISSFNNYTILSNMKHKKPKVTIGVVTALPKEFAAVRLILDQEMIPQDIPSADSNDYCFGYINCLDGTQAKVVIALMKGVANNNAAITATNLLRSFEEIDDVIICGIAGAVPNPKKSEDHVRLGDIVISDMNGVLQYDNIKDTGTHINIRDTGTHINIRDTSSKPSAKLIGITNKIKAEYEINNIPWLAHLNKYEGGLRNSMRPDHSKDVLKINGVISDHPLDNFRIESQPKVFYGPIGSANTLLKNEEKRNYLRDKYNVKAIEMEGSGIADGTWSLSKGYLIVRGTVDYCNPDKNDDWHNYAAICAASYTKAIIERL